MGERSLELFPSVPKKRELSSELYLIGNNGFTANVYKTITIGRDWCRIFGDEYKHVSPDQFRIEKTGDSWKISGLPGAKNPTLINGRSLKGNSEILTGEELLSIGKLFLRVKIVKKITKNPDECGYKKIQFSWKDHFDHSWNWGYVLSEKLVQKAQREYGLTHKAWTGDYYGKKGFHISHNTLFIDYSSVGAKNLARVKDIAMSLSSLCRADCRGDKYKLLSIFLSFVQSIPYRVPPEKAEDRDIFGFFTPLEVLYWGFGDCDSKCVLLGSIWKNLFSDVIAFIEVLNHLMIGISNIDGPSLPRNVSILESEGLIYLVCEAAGPALLKPGDVPQYEKYKRKISKLHKF